MKVCITCLQSKPLEAFCQNLSYRDKKNGSCRACRNAYAAERRRNAGIPPYPLFLNRIWDAIDQCGHEDICPFCCWPWQKTRDQNGYGRIGLTVRGKTSTHLITRVIFEIWHMRPLSPRQLVLHHCDFPPCCNPLHLFAGTFRDNTQDCLRKGRANRPHGESHPKSKLVTANILEIRSLYEQGLTARDLSKLFHVTPQSIKAITQRKSWKHI